MVARQQWKIDDASSKVKMEVFQETDCIPLVKEGNIAWLFDLTALNVARCLCNRGSNRSNHCLLKREPSGWERDVKF